MVAAADASRLRLLGFLAFPIVSIGFPVVLDPSPVDRSTATQDFFDQPTQIRAGLDKEITNRM